MRFSDRTPSDLTPNRLSRAQMGVSGSQPVDFTLSNPTQCGFDYPPELLEGLGQASSLIYNPLPFGLPSARQAVAGYLDTKGIRTKVENVLLTASTSEAYSYLFKLLGNPGDSFLIPNPGYPLLDHLLRLESLVTVPYSLLPQTHWPLDRDHLSKAVRANTRGIVAVNPQNPTGCFLSGEDQDEILRICRKQDLAYISDEVFADFAYPGFKPAPSLPAEGVLTFRLGGLSKSLGLPQLKLSWILLEGPESLVNEAKERLELIADTYLSVNAPVQLAVPNLLKGAPVFQDQVMRRILTNRAALEAGLKEMKGVKVWPAQGGWYALVEITQVGISDEALAIDLAEKRGLWVHPGGFFDISQGCFLILSLLLPAEVFREGLNRLQRGLGEVLGL